MTNFDKLQGIFQLKWEELCCAVNVNNSIGLKQLCWNQICKMIDLSLSPPFQYSLSCHDLISLSVFSVSGTPFCYVLAAAFCCCSLTLESVSKVTLLQSAALWQMTDSTAYSSILLYTAPCCRSQWIPNLNRWLHRDRITRFSASMGRKVDFTFDLCVLLTALGKIFVSFNTRAKWLYQRVNCSKTG